ncbi:MAG TPA: TetR/AcrR family transcriptional regulator [Gemmatimonadaceae bacterium]|nr:TetR/AcrR family transcriptional regulator [Gemmatimonadaceae bacterium]
MPTPYHHGNLKQALVDAALEILYADGAAAMTLRAVARRAGVTQAAPYHHFADRDALLAVVAEVGFGQLLGALDQVRAAGSPNPRRTMQDLAVVYVRFAIDHPAHYRLMFGNALAEHEPYPALGQCVLELRRRISEVVTLLQARGLARRGEPDELALTVWSLAHGLAMLMIDGQMRANVAEPDDVEHLVREEIGLLLHGMMSTSSLAPPASADRAAHARKRILG